VSEVRSHGRQLAGSIAVAVLLVVAVIGIVTARLPAVQSAFPEVEERREDAQRAREEASEERARAAEEASEERAKASEDAPDR
jgi:hypothetical protein